MLEQGVDHGHAAGAALEDLEHELEAAGLEEELAVLRGGEEESDKVDAPAAKTLVLRGEETEGKLEASCRSEVVKRDDGGGGESEEEEEEIVVELREVWEVHPADDGLEDIRHIGSRPDPTTHQHKWRRAEEREQRGRRREERRRTVGGERERREERRRTVGGGRERREERRRTVGGEREGGGEKEDSGGGEREEGGEKRGEKEAGKGRGGEGCDSRSELPHEGDGETPEGGGESVEEVEEARGAEERHPQEVPLDVGGGGGKQVNEEEGDISILESLSVHLPGGEVEEEAHDRLARPFPCALEVLVYNEAEDLSGGERRK
eukprot:768796-Hanusia_phi.AAC.10